MKFCGAVRVSSWVSVGCRRRRAECEAVPEYFKTSGSTPLESVAHLASRVERPTEDYSARSCGHLTLNSRDQV